MFKELQVGGGIGLWLGTQTPELHDLPPSVCVTLHKVLNLSRLQLSYLRRGDDASQGQ